jgi:hypothetical protein
MVNWTGKWEPSVKSALCDTFLCTNIFAMALEHSQGLCCATLKKQRATSCQFSEQLVLNGQ